MQDAIESSAPSQADELVMQHLEMLFNEPREYWGEAYLHLVVLAEKVITRGKQSTLFPGQVVLALRLARVNQYYADRHLNKKHTPIAASQLPGNLLFADFTAVTDHRERGPSFRVEQEESDRVFYDALSALPPDCREVAFLAVFGVPIKIVQEITGIGLKGDRMRRVKCTLVDRLELNGGDKAPIQRYLSRADGTKLTDAHENLIIGLLRDGWRYDRIARLFNSDRKNIQNIVQRYNEHNGTNVAQQPFLKPLSDATVSRVTELESQGLSLRSIAAVMQTKRHIVNWIIKNHTNIGPRLHPSRNNSLPDVQAIQAIVPLRRRGMSFAKIASQLHLCRSRVRRLWASYNELTVEPNAPFA